MIPHKLITIPPAVTPANFAEVMQQAVALELATIPTYLSTYYSISRAQDQDALYAKLQAQLAARPGAAEEKEALVLEKYEAALISERAYHDQMYEAKREALEAELALLRMFGGEESAA